MTALELKTFQENRDKYLKEKKIIIIDNRLLNIKK